MPEAVKKRNPRMAASSEWAKASNRLDALCNQRIRAGERVEELNEKIREAQKDVDEALAAMGVSAPTPVRTP